MDIKPKTKEIMLEGKIKATHIFHHLSLKSSILRTFIKTADKAQLCICFEIQQNIYQVLLRYKVSFHGGTCFIIFIQIDYIPLQFFQLISYNKYMR